MAFAVGVNSFASVAEANDYHSLSPYSASGWAALDAERREALLVMATRLLTDLIRWLGEPMSTTQALPWPRSGLLTRNGDPVDSTVVPGEIKRAQAELAWQMDATDRRADQPIADLDIRQVGSIKFGPASFRRVIPATVIEMIPAAWHDTEPDDDDSPVSVEAIRA